ncbi:MULTISPECIES: hypothetical protein [unclassified Streptomyces]|uniref:hypothetical protein n=1 Tax=unclassified Streptomyces TaxID=2593676 RepID=UPI002F912035
MAAEDRQSTNPAPGPMTTVHSPPGFRVIGVEEAEEWFRGSADARHPAFVPSRRRYGVKAAAL